MIEPTVRIESYILEFLERDLPGRRGVETVVLCGSHAAGRATERSDVDLCYIGAFEGFRRECLHAGGREFQLMIAPWDWYEHVVEEYERRGNMATIIVMLAGGLCLSGDGERWRRLRELARRSHEAGPEPPSATAIRKQRFAVTELWDDYCDAADERERLWLSHAVLTACIDALFVIRRWWAVKPKNQLAEIRRRDPAAAELLDRCLAAPGMPEPLEAFCDYVLEPAGGWLRESWMDGHTVGDAGRVGEKP